MDQKSRSDIICSWPQRSHDPPSRSPLPTHVSIEADGNVIIFQSIWWSLLPHFPCTTRISILCAIGLQERSLFWIWHQFGKIKKCNWFLIKKFSSHLLKQEADLCDPNAMCLSPSDFCRRSNFHVAVFHDYVRLHEPPLRSKCAMERGYSLRYKRSNHPCRSSEFHN